MGIYQMEKKNCPMLNCQSYPKSVYFGVRNISLTSSLTYELNIDKRIAKDNIYGHPAFSISHGTYILRLVVLPSKIF